MKEYVISSSDAGRRMDKFSMHILSGAGASFTYKMLRKKNITLNDKKASGTEILSEGDIVKFYLSDETFDKFTKGTAVTFHPVTEDPAVVYEDDDFLIVDKPSGMLSQKSSAGDISLNEICLSYVRKKDAPSGSFTPSICNRLDRNTSGLVTFAKTYRASVVLSKAFRERLIHKYYNCVVSGVVGHDLDLKGSLIKDEKTNTVTVYDDDKGSYINTIVHPIRDNGRITLLEIELITGKTHQIRAHLSFEGYPIVGDIKYGDRAVNKKYMEEYGISSQMLRCTKMIFPEDKEYGALSGRTVSVDLSDEFDRVF